MNLNNKQKGTVTELKCLLQLIEMGIDVSIPYGDNSRYDFIIDYKNKLYRLQCKTSRSTGNGIFQFATKSNNWSTKKRYSYENDIDFFITYINGNCYLVPIDECKNQTAFTIRFLPSKNKQVKNIHMADDYLLKNQLMKLSMHH